VEIIEGVCRYLVRIGASFRLLVSFSAALMTDVGG
jgi:hypothetical protein